MTLHFTDEFYQTFKELILILHKFYQNVAEKQMLPNAFHEVNMNLIPKQKYQKKKKNPIALMNIDEKIFNKILSSQIQ